MDVTVHDSHVQGWTERANTPAGRRFEFFHEKERSGLSGHKHVWFPVMPKESVAWSRYAQGASPFNIIIFMKYFPDY